MRFPPTAYTARGGVGSVAAQERLEAARQQPDGADTDLEQDQAPAEPERIAA
jgi:hypothetical protein